MLNRDGVRLLTSGEIYLARELFRNSIEYNKVWIHHGSYLPFDIQSNNTAMTPNGEMWFEKDVYRDDFSQTTIDYQYLFMHEMMHVWQYQHGMNVRMRGLVSWVVDYKYDFDKSSLSFYPMEQQASIVADYWLLTMLDYLTYHRMNKYKNHERNKPVNDLTEKYRSILRCFP